MKEAFDFHYYSMTSLGNVLYLENCRQLSVCIRYGANEVNLKTTDMENKSYKNLLEQLTHRSLRRICKLRFMVPILQDHRLTSSPFLIWGRWNISTATRNNIFPPCSSVPFATQIMQWCLSISVYVFPPVTNFQLKEFISIINAHIGTRFVTFFAISTGIIF